MKSQTIARVDALGSFHPPSLRNRTPLLKDAILFRPAVIYNPMSERYVLWINRIPRGYSVWDGYTRGGFVVAEASEMFHKPHG